LRRAVGPLRGTVYLSFFSARCARKLSIVPLILGLFFSLAPVGRPQSAPTLPQGGAFVAGSGTIGAATNGSLTINQNAARGIIDWRSFSIGAGGRVFFQNGSGATLNRVLGGDLSRIDGLLKASGSIYLINPNGIVVGPNGTVLTGGSFVASTRDTSNSAFLSVGNMSFSGTSTGGVDNLGTILSREGNVLLIGNSVQNAGSITAANGTASLLAGNNILLTTVNGPSGIYVSPDAGASGDITQTGRIAAAAAALKAAGGNIYTLAGNRSGLISATGTRNINGEIWLSAPEGSVNTSGTLSAQNTDGTGGQIVANGSSVSVASGSHISAQGTSGGSVLIGTSVPGGVDLANDTSIASGAVILAGGPQGGGSIETSGRNFSIGRARVEAGKGGNWLVDPTDLTIDSTAALTIASSLNSGTNVTEQTTASGASGAGVQSAGSGDINVNSPITWTGTGALTLSAYNNLNINAAISGSGNLTGSAGGVIAANANVSAASILLSAAGNLSIASGVSIAAGNGVTLQTSGQFINNAGANALSGGSGNWLVYSTNPANDTTGGLTPNFYQYNANWNAPPATSGNGLLYSIAPGLSVALSGTVEKTYDGTTAAVFSGTNATVSGLINGDSASVTGSYADKNAGSGIGVTASSISVTHGGIPVYGYAGTSPSVSANIGQIDRATLSASIVGDPTKTYNGTTTAELTSSNYQLAGFVAGEGASVNQPSSVGYDSADAGARTISATFSPTNFVANNGTNLSNYNLPASATGAGTINPAPLYISGVLATDKTYDRSTNDPLNTSGATLHGIIGSDNVSLDRSGAAGVFATSNAGSNLAVTASGFALTGSKAADYSLIQPQSLSANISQATLSITGVTANNKTYDGTTAATLSTGSATLNGVVSGDTLTLGTGSASGAFASSDAGSNIAVSASGFTISGAGASNYSLSQPSGLTANIAQKAITVAITSTPTKTYNGDSSAVVGSSGFTLSGFVAGQSATIGQTAHTSYASANAGTQTVTATLAISDYVAGSGTRLSNYLLPSSATGTGVINQAPITISLIGNPTKTYDGNVSAILSASNFLLTGFLNGESATVNQTSGTYDSPNAGVRQVTANLSLSNFTPGSGTLLSNYSFPTSVTGYGIINPAPLGVGYIGASITGNPTKTYDGTTTATLQPSDFTLTGFLNGDGATVTQTVGQYASKNVGVQPVTASLTSADFTPNQGTNLSNYTLPTVAYGSGTINPAALNISIIGTPTKVYNGTTTATLSAANFSVSGLAPGEGINIAGGVPSFYDSTQAGSRTITANLPATDITPQSGTLLSNYTIPATATGAGLITQAPLSILGISAQSKTYDTTTTATIAGSASLFGVVGSDNVTLSTSGVTANFATPNAANNVAVSASGYTISGSDAANYQLNQPSGLFANIYRAPLSITGVSAQNKNYDATNAASLNLGSAALSGVYSADSGQVSLDSSNAAATFSSVNVGNNLSVAASGFGLAGAQSANYYLNQPSGLSANINPAPLTALIIGNPTKVYDGTNSVTLHASNYQLVGFASGQGASVPQNASASYVAPDAGSEGITSTLVSSDFVANNGTNLANYILPTTGSGTGTITPAPLTVKIVGNPTKTYDATTAATLNSSNFVLSGFIGSQGATVTLTAGTYGSANAGTETVSATLASNNFTAAGSTNLNNYQLPVSASGTGTINKAPLQVIDVNATSRAYNGTYNDTLDVSNAAVSGLFGTDTVNLNTGSATGLFASKDAGTNIAVTASGFTISGGASNNYTVVQPTGLAADITQATLQLTKVVRVYDSTTDLPTASSAYTLSGIFGSDSVSVDTTNITGSYADKNVATGKNVTINNLQLANSGQSSDYTIASTVNAAIGQITPAPLTVANVRALDKVYDSTNLATLDNSSAALSGLFAGDNVTLQTGTTAFFSDKNAGTNKTVTASGYSISGTDQSNYKFTQPTGLTASITPYTGISLTGIAKTYDGTTNLPGVSSDYTLTGIFNGDSVSVNASGITGAFAQKDVGSNLNVNLAGLQLTGTDAGNYSMSSTLSNAPIGTITQKSLSASIVGTPTKTYDTTTAATLTSGNFNLSGFVAGESATVTKTTGAYTSANAGTPNVTTTLASGDFTANGATLLSNYILPTSATGAGKINKAALTITGVLATDKVYNGTTADTLNTGSAALSGVFASDLANVSLIKTGATGTFGSAGVGSNKPVTASGFSISGGQSGNYTLSQPTGLTANITQAMLNLASVSKMYDATTAATGAGVSYALSGIQGSDNVFVNTAGLSGTYAAKNVGTNLSVSFTGLSLTGAQAANYSIASSVTNALIGTITKAPLSLTGAVGVGKTYDGTTSAVINNASAALAGVLGSDSVTFSGPTTGTFSSSNAGTWAVTPSSSYAISGTDAANYNFTQPGSFSATIAKAPLTAAIINNPTKTYDATTAATLSSGNYLLSGFIGSQSATISQTAGSYDSSDAGSRIVTASLSAGNFTAGGGTNLSNYILPTTASGAGAINQKALTAAIIGNPTKTYDGTLAAALNASNFSLTGFVSGQSATVNQASGTYDAIHAGARTVTAALNAGDFTAGGSTNLANYVLPGTASGAGTINPQALTASIIGDPSKTYDGTSAATLTGANYQLSGFVAGEGASVNQTSGIYDSSNAGARTVTASLNGSNFAATGATQLSDYTLPTTASGAGNINPKVLTAVIINNPSKIYDATTAATLSAANYQINGFVGSDGAIVSQSAGTYAAPDAGTQPISALLTAANFAPTGSTNFANYILPGAATGNGTITPKSLSAAITGNPGKTYDGLTTASLAPSDYTLSGFVAGQGATVLQDTGTYDSANAGARTVTATLAPGDFNPNNGTNLANYILPVSATGTGNITQKALTAQIVNDPTKTYDGNTSATLTNTNYQLNGFIGSEGATVNQTAGNYAAPDAGSENVTASLAANNFSANGTTNLANYLLPTTAAGLGTINPKSLIASITGTPTKTYDGTSSATLASSDYALTGFVAGQGAGVTQTAGTYDLSDAGPRTVTVSLGANDYNPNAGTNLANYSLPTTATGSGLINQAPLTATIANVSKTYDGSNAATLAPGNYQLTGFVAGQGATITQSFGTYDSANAGSRTVDAALASGDFNPNNGTNLANYILPTSATGTGSITPKALAAQIINDPTKTYDANTQAALTSANYQLSGFVGNEGATVNQTGATYAAADAGSQNVTASLAPGNFAPIAGTNLANYSLPVTASGPGTITPKALTAAITGNPTKHYDGTNSASLAASDYTLTGFVNGQSAAITQTFGTYDASDAGARTVSATLAAGNFIAAPGTSLANYSLPASATGAGQIDPALLTATIVNASKTYDGTTAATLAPGNFTITGFAPGQGAAITQTAGTYASADAGSRAITSNLAAADFAANSSTNLANYILPEAATGTGLINPKALVAAITGAPSKVYDGTANALLTPADYTLSGFVNGQGASITQSAGLYDSANAGSRNILAILNSQDFQSAAGTNLANYILPLSAAGQGTITPRALTAQLIGTPTKMNDGTLNALLTPANFALSGFVTGQGAMITQTAGLYDLAQTGPRTVSAPLSPQNFRASDGTLLSNYFLPAIATGPGLITPAVETNAPTFAAAISDNMTVRNLAPAPVVVQTAVQALFAAAVPRTYIPYPAPSALSTWQNNGFGSLPAIVETGNALSNAPVINSTEQILLQGGKNKNWTIALPSTSVNQQAGRGR